MLNSIRPIPETSKPIVSKDKVEVPRQSKSAHQKSTSEPNGQLNGVAISSNGNLNGIVTSDHGKRKRSSADADETLDAVGRTPKKFRQGVDRSKAVDDVIVIDGPPNSNDPFAGAIKIDDD